jgi:predicted HTH domain antitoxin
MGSISARVPDSLREELERFVEDENLDRSTAVRKLLSEGLELWRVEKAVEKLEDGDVSFSRAAELAGMDKWSFADILKERDVQWVDDKQRSDLEEI